MNASSLSTQTVRAASPARLNSYLTSCASAGLFSTIRTRNGLVTAHQLLRTAFTSLRRTSWRGDWLRAVGRRLSSIRTEFHLYYTLLYFTGQRLAPTIVRARQLSSNGLLGEVNHCSGV